MTSGKLLLVHGWTVFAHPLFLAQIDTLARQVETLKQKDPAGYMNPLFLAQIDTLARQVETLKQKDPAGCLKKSASKRLAAVTKLAFDIIPQDPARPEYRQGGALGNNHKHWFRAKFFQQYRLFFRYHAPSKVIVYAWVNDEDTRRAYESDDDVYRVFRKMLESGHPPDDWEQLLAEAH